MQIFVFGLSAELQMYLQMPMNRVYEASFNYLSNAAQQLNLSDAQLTFLAPRGIMHNACEQWNYLELV